MALRVVQVNKYYPPHMGGVEQVVRDTSIGLMTMAATNGGQLAGLEGYGDLDLEVIVGGGGPGGSSEYIEGVPVRRLRTFGRLAGAPLAPGLITAPGRSKADILHFHFPSPPGEMASWFLPKDIPLVVTYHCDIVGPQHLGTVYQPIVNRFLRRADRILVTNPRVLEHSKTLAPFQDKCRVVPLGIETEPYEMTDEIAAKVREIKESVKGRPIVLFAGRLVYYKGLEYLLKAFTDLVCEPEYDSSRDPVLVLVGSGPLNDDLHRQVRGLGIEGSVVFTGRLDDPDLIAHMHACEMLVFPSIASSEAFGLVQIEAGLCSKPSICTDLPTGVPWVNQHEKTGIVVPPEDSEALSHAMAHLLARDDIARQYGAAFKERVLTEFTRERMVARVVEVYKELL